MARVIELTNAERGRVGVAPLAPSATLALAAQGYAEVLAEGPCFGHNCGSTLSERLDRAGYRERAAWGENIASGYATPEAVVAGWMSSTGHRANILSDQYRDLGVGVAIAGDTGRLYWVQNFGRSRTPGGVPPPPPADCSTRPTFAVRAEPASPGLLRVTVAAGRTAGAPGNALRAIRVGQVANGSVEVAAHGPVASGATVSMVAGARDATLLIRRTAGGAATTVPLTLTDDCGEWRTFVGGGPAAF